MTALIHVANFVRPWETRLVQSCETFCLYQTAKSFFLSVNRHFFVKLELKKLKSQFLSLQLHDRVIDHTVSRRQHIRCSYTRHVCRGKWPFYHGKLHWMRASDISQGRFLVVNFHGHLKNIRWGAHNILRGKLEGCFDVRGTRANHDTDEVVIKFPANEMRNISFYLVILATCDHWLTRSTKTRVG